MASRTAWASGDKGFSSSSFLLLFPDILLLVTLQLCVLSQYEDEAQRCEIGFSRVYRELALPTNDPTQQDCKINYDKTDKTASMYLGRRNSDYIRLALNTMLKNGGLLFLAEHNNASGGTTPTVLGTY